MADTWQRPRLDENGRVFAYLVDKHGNAISVDDLLDTIRMIVHSELKPIRDALARRR